MRYKIHFIEQQLSQMTDVWKEVFNLFIDLRDESYAHIDESGQEWYCIKLDEFVFINIVKTIYDRLNTPNSRSLVKKEFDALSPASISRDYFQIIKGNEITKIINSHITEYERNILFGGVYYVLSKQKKSLAEPSVVEKVKQIICYKGNPSVHYFLYFEEALYGKPLPIAPVITYRGRTVEEYNANLEKSKRIEMYKKWIDGILNIDSLLHPEAIKELQRLKECLSACQASLPLHGVKPQDCGEKIESPIGISPDDIKSFIKEEFADLYDEYFPSLQKTELVDDNVIKNPPSFFRTDAQSVTCIEKEWRKAMCLKAKTNIIRYLLERSRSDGYFNFDGLTNQQRADALNSAQNKIIFAANDFENANKPLKKSNNVK